MATNKPPEIEPTREKEFVYVLIIGKTGNGKSSTGNTILGPEDEVFQPLGGTKSSKKNRLQGITEFKGYRFVIADTPGLFDTSEKKTNSDTLKEIVDIALDNPNGIHVFLIVCDGNARFTAEEVDAFKLLKKKFGSQLFKHSILVMTHGGEILERNGSIKGLMDKDENLRAFVEELSGGAILLENNTGEDHISVEMALQREMALSAIINVMQVNEGSMFTPELFKVAHDGLMQRMKHQTFLKKIDNRLFRKFVENMQTPYDLESLKQNVMETIQSDLPQCSDFMDQKFIRFLTNSFCNFHKTVLENAETKDEATEKQTLRNELREWMNIEGELVIVKYVKTKSINECLATLHQAQVGHVEFELLEDVNRELPGKFKSDILKFTVEEILSGSVLIHTNMRITLYNHAQCIARLATLASSALGMTGVTAAMLAGTVTATAAFGVVASGGFLVPIIVGGVAIVYVYKKIVPETYG